MPIKILLFLWLPLFRPQQHCSQRQVVSKVCPCRQLGISWGPETIYLGLSCLAEHCGEIEVVELSSLKMPLSPATGACVGHRLALSPQTTQSSCLSPCSTGSPFLKRLTQPFKVVLLGTLHLWWWGRDAANKGIVSKSSLSAGKEDVSPQRPLTSACEGQRTPLVGGRCKMKHPCLVPFMSLGLANGSHL